jgi:sec-independent protein translocase protein TatA
MGDLLQPWHIILLAIVLFLLFGVRRLPGLGKGLGEGWRGFREGIRGVFDPLPPAPPAQRQNTAPAPPASNAPAEPKQS